MPKIKGNPKYSSGFSSGPLDIIGAFMLLKDTYYYVKGIVDPQKSETDYAKDVVDGLKNNYEAINRNQHAIQNVGEKLDRNFVALNLLFEFVNSTLSAIEETRLDILQAITNSKIDFTISNLNNQINYFKSEMKIVESLSEQERIDRLIANEDLLKDLEQARTPKKHTLNTYLRNIIDQGHAIPESGSDKKALSSLDGLYYGTQTYVSVMFFLLQQYSYLADYYFRSNDIDRFNEYFSSIVNTFDTFRLSLLNSDARKSLIDNVIKVFTDAQQRLKYETDISSDLSQRLQSLSSIKHQLEKMELPVMRKEPDQIFGNPEFEEPEIRTPIGEWKDGAQVSYAIQYKNKALYSKVGKWSNPFPVTDKANPTLKIPLDKVNGKSRVIFRKFNNDIIELVGVLEDVNEIKFRDINRDLYNAALSSNKDKALKEVSTYVESGANINAVFDNRRKAIHAAAQRDNIQVAKDFLINGDSTNMLNAKDSDGFTPMHIAAAAGHDDFIEFLIESGANINEKTYSEELTPLHVAVYKGYKSTVEALMRSSEIDFNAHDKRGFTPLHSAVLAGVPIVEALMSNENVDINAKSDSDLTPLHMSIIEHFPDITETLLKSDKIDVNAETLGNITALHFASLFGHTDMVKRLIEKPEIDINAQALDNWTPLHVAVSLERTDVASEMLQDDRANVNIAAGDGLTALHLAAIAGLKTIITELIEKKAEIEAQTRTGLTPLHLAATEGHHQAVSTLIDNGANLEARTSGGLTPLLSAASSKNSTAEVINILLERGANLKAKADNGEYYSQIALKKGNSDVVKFIISEDKEYYDQDGSGNYFLHYAAQGGNLDVVKYLIEKKGNFVNVKNFNKETPLHFAAKSENLNLVQYLIDEQRASIDARNNASETPVYFAAENGNLDIVMYLIEEKDAYVNETMVFLAVKSENLDVVKYLIEERNMNVNIRDEEDQTVLHLAAKSGNLDLVKYFTEKHDMNIDASDQDDQTVLHFAARSGNLNLVKYLINEGANVFAKTYYDQSPLNFGIQSGNMELVKYLAEKTLGPDIDFHHIDVPDEYGQTSLYYAIRNNNLDLAKYLVNLGAVGQSDETLFHFAVQYSNVDMVKYLLNIGANINSTGYKNITPLHLALWRNDSDIVHCLLDKGGIDVTVKDDWNTTSLHLAAQVSLDVVKYLLEKGADIDAKRQNKLCSTPLCFAIDVGNFEIVKYLIKEGANIDDAVNPEFVSVDLLNHNITNLDTLHFAASVNDSNVVKYLVQEGAEPNKPPLNGFSLLGTAASKCNFDLVQYFVEKGSDFSGHSDDYPLLHIAAEAGNLDIVKYLIDQGLDVNVKRSSGQTTLQTAAESGSVDLVKYLTEKTEADINDTYGEKYTLLHASVVSDNLNLVKYLIDEGASVNAKSSLDYTPLHLAADDFHFNIVKYLVKKNADINALNTNSETPVYMAVSHYNRTYYSSLMQYFTVRYLVEQGADVNIEDENGSKLEDRAANYHLEKIKDFLREYMLSLKVRDAIKEGNLDIIEQSIVEGANLGFTDKNGSTLLHFAAKEGKSDVVKLLVSKGANLYVQDEKNKTPSDTARDNNKYKLAKYLENVKYSADFHYHKRDIAQQLKNDASHHNIAKRNLMKTTSSEKNIVGSTESNVASGASKPFSLINVFVTILLNSVKSITSVNYFFKPNLSGEYCKPSTAVTADDINTNSSLFLLDVIIKKVTGQKNIYTADTTMSLSEANGYALDIVSLFERVVRQAALYSKISLHRLNIDFVEVQNDCISKVLGNKFNEIPEILKFHMERACPDRAAGGPGKLSMKKFDKFKDEFNKVLHITMSQWMKNTLEDRNMTEVVKEATGQPLGLEYKEHLSRNSVQYV